MRCNIYKLQGSSEMYRNTGDVQFVKQKSMVLLKRLSSYHDVLGIDK
jgi:hypothetical protein